MKYATSLEVAKSFGKYQDEALAEEAIAVTRYGRPTVIIVSYAEYERLAAGQPARRRVVRRAEEMPDDLLAELDRVIDDLERRVDGRESADATARS